ncbi:MAG: sulfatase-like hydrolase/transferase, partial [Bdellovibrionales bacterium]|nr:sulfatase-like hydrolase/transferase [Bdellovibrionales bacterium]
MALFIVTGCDWTSRIRPSVLVIAVDSLRFDDFDCASNRQFFDSLCGHSIRFTHHFTTSTMSVPALGGLLAGRYPFESRLTNNGSNYLSAQVQTVAEDLVQKGFRTAFFGGGPPVWRKSGLSQGFEIFDDYVTLNSSRLYRDAQSNVELFLDWYDSEAKDQSFFGVLYLPDLQFSQFATISELGMARARNRAGQLEEVSESVEYLVQQLIKRNVWQSTTVILVGLNGAPDKNRPGEVDPINLYTENTRTALLIKPFEKQKNEGRSWGVDVPVNLVDVSRYIRETLNVPFFYLFGRIANTLSIKEGILSGEFTSGERNLIMESSWPSWRIGKPTRFAAIQGERLVFYQDPLVAYNIWSDRFQVSPIDNRDRKVMEQFLSLGNYLNELGYMPFEPLTRRETERFWLAKDLWGSAVFNEGLLSELDAYLRGHPDDWEVKQWMALWLLRLRYWRKFLELGETVQSELWVYLAKRNLDIKVKEPNDTCFDLIRRGGSPDEAIQDFRSCENEAFRNLVAWVRSRKTGADEEHFRERFLNVFKRYRLDRRIGEI